MKLSPGRYIVAVSGGVDSVVLLTMLSKLPDLDLVVAHFDHGMRNDSLKDAQFVKELAKEYGFSFELGEGNLGDVSEATARAARYKFLESVKNKHKAKAIMTAHHQDDVLETMIINLLRGTGRLGLTSLKSSKNTVRPLLGCTKKQLQSYAKQQNLQWREDSTNSDTKFFRNRVRLEILPQINEQQCADLLKIHQQLLIKNKEINQEIETILQNKEELSRALLVSLDHQLCCELIAHILRSTGIVISRPLVERIVVASKVAYPGKYIHIDKNYQLEVGKKSSKIVKKF